MNRYVSIILLSFSFASFAELEADQFDRLLKTFDEALKILDDNFVSSTQLDQIADRMRVLEEKLVEQTMSTFKPSPFNVPADAKVMIAASKTSGAFIFSPVKEIERKRQDLGSDKTKERKAKRQRRTARAAKKVIESEEETEDEAIISHVIYTHTIFAGDYLSNYIKHTDRINAAEVIADLQKKYSAKIIKHRLMLHTELKLRQLVADNPRLLDVVKYVGQAKSDEHRVRGHSSDLKDPLKVAGTRKAKFESEAIKSGASIRMNTLVYNLPKEYLDVFEALVADVFGILVSGCGAVIADTDAHKELLKYKKWSPRTQVLAREDVENVVENGNQFSIRRNLFF